MKERIKKIIEQFYTDKNVAVTEHAPSPEELAEFIDNGISSHQCGCGNTVNNSYNDDELCNECKKLYGHSFESEL